MQVVQNPVLKELIAPEYSLERLAQIRRLLEEKQTLSFPSYSTGLFSASIITPASAHTGYHATWVRDNVYVAYAHYVNGRLEAASRTATALCTFFAKQLNRFQAIIQNPARASDPMNRPHIRFEGATLEEIKKKWPHAQNDALGYFLWLYSKLAQGGSVPLNASEADTLSLFPRYVQAIRYWQDEDSGHWEEVRKISASSIGTVLAGLVELQKLSQDAERVRQLSPHPQRKTHDRLQR
jgi:phosphorylase kinase alpha/beta subunit